MNKYLSLAAGCLLSLSLHAQDSMLNIFAKQNSKELTHVLNLDKQAQTVSDLHGYIYYFMPDKYHLSNGFGEIQQGNWIVQPTMELVSMRNNTYQDNTVRIWVNIRQILENTDFMLTLNTLDNQGPICKIDGVFSRGKWKRSGYHELNWHFTQWRWASEQWIGYQVSKDMQLYIDCMWGKWFKTEDSTEREGKIWAKVRL